MLKKILSLVVLSVAFATAQVVAQNETQQSEEVVVLSVETAQDREVTAAALKKAGLSNEEILKTIKAATEPASKEGTVNKIKKFVKEHKYECAAVTAVIVVGGGVYLYKSGKGVQLYNGAKARATAAKDFVVSWLPGSSSTTTTS